MKLKHNLLAVTTSGKRSNNAVYLFERHSEENVPWKQIKKIDGIDDLSIQHFGMSIDIDHDQIIIGAPGISLFGGNPELKGRAFIFDKDEGGHDNWGLSQTLMGSDSSGGNGFGYSVSIKNNTILVGAIKSEKKGSGTIYLFEKNNQVKNSWKEQKKIALLDEKGKNQRSCNIILEDKLAFVGACGYTVNRRYSCGSVYVLQKDVDGSNDWKEIQNIVPPDYKSGYRFGKTFSLADDKLLIGRPGDDAQGHGSAYIYQYNDVEQKWNQVQKFGDQRSSVGDRYGWSTSIDKDYLVIGAPEVDNGIMNTGAVYIHHKHAGGRDNWGLIKTITLAHAKTRTNFGNLVSIKDNTILVGSKKDAYIFEKDAGGINNWAQVKEIKYPARNPFGGKIVMQNSNILISNPHANDRERGSVSLYNKDFGGTNNWGEIKRFTAPDNEAADRFGKNISMSGDLICVGTGRNLVNQSVYIYCKDHGKVDQWDEVKVIDAPVSDTIYFGTSIAIHNDLLVVGAKLDYGSKGCIYLYGKDIGGENNWGLIQKIQNPFPEECSLFGNQVAIKNDELLITASMKDGSEDHVYMSKTDNPSSFQKIDRRQDPYLIKSDNETHLDLYGKKDNCKSIYSDIFEFENRLWPKTNVKENPHDPAELDHGYFAQYSVYLNNETETSSSITSKTIAILGDDNYVSFLALTKGLKKGSSLSFDISDDNGKSFTPLKEWIVEKDFSNNVKNNFTVKLPELLVPNTFRFSCHTSESSELVIIDNIIVDMCSYKRVRASGKSK